MKLPRLLILLALTSITNLLAQTDLLNIEWDPNPETDIDYYQIQKAVNSTTDFVDLGSVTHPATTTEDTDVLPGQLYSYRIAAVDVEGNHSGYSSIVSVGLPEVLLTLPSITTGQDTTFDLTPWINDPDHSFSDFTLEITAEQNCSVTGAAGFMTITPDPIDYTGSASFSLRAEDPDELFDIKTINFNFVQGAIQEFTVSVPDVQMDEDDAFLIWLDTCVTITNYDPSELVWSFITPADLTTNYNASNRIVSVHSQNPHWSGTGLVTATATAPDNSQESDDFLTTINPINDEPVATISQVFISETPDENLVDLDDFVVDVDNDQAELDWEFWGYLHFQIQWEDESNHIIRITPLDETLEETANFRVFDPAGAADTVSVTITVIPDPDEFFIVEVPDQRFDEDQSTMIFMDTTVNISNYSPSDLSWSFVPGPDLSYDYDPESRVVTIQAAETDWFGQNTISAIATAPDQSSAGDTFFVDIDPVNDAPGLSMSTLFVHEDSDSNLFYLGDYAVDVDNSSGELQWDFWGFGSFNIAWEDEGAQIIRIIPQGSSTEESGFFSVEDPFGAADTAAVLLELLESGEVIFEVNVPDARFDEDNAFDILMDTTLSLSHFSPADITWDFVSGEHLSHEFNALTHKLTISTVETNWYGTDEMVAIALAPDQSTRVDTFQVIVDPVNDVPVAAVEDMFVSPFSDNIYDMKLYASDEDHSAAEIDWHFWGFDQFTITWYDQDTKLIQIFPGNDAQSQTGFFRAVDPEGAADTALVTIEYLTENTAPVLKFPFLISMGEDSTTMLNLVRYVVDSTNTIDELVLDFSAGSNLSLDFNSSDYTLHISPDADWSGNSSFTVTATDPLELASAQTMQVTVQERNDIQEISLSSVESDQVEFQINTELPSTVDLSYWENLFQITTISRTSYLRQHTIALNNLSENTEYHFNLRITDESGKVISIADSTFITGAVTTPEVESPLIVYPNPIKPSSGHNEMIFVNLPQQTHKVMLYSILGNKVFEEELQTLAPDYRIPVVNGPVTLPSGVYIYLVKDSDARVLDRGKIAIIR